MSDNAGFVMPLTVDVEAWQDASTWGTMEERTARGLAWLHEEGPRFGWLDVSRIDPQRLSMIDPYNCALAQAAADVYDSAIERVTGHGWLDIEVTNWAVAHGFMTDGESFATLTETWRQLLAPSVTVE